MKEISLPLEPKIILDEGNKAVFEIAALYPGYGATLGNALRRVLLSSIPGAAVTSAKIENVSHEFTTIPYVLEDIVDILLNLKQVRVKMMVDEPQKLTLHAKGEREVKAGDIEPSATCEIVNKDLLLATLTHKKAELSLELTVERGMGYSPAEERKKDRLPLGTIVLDAIFSPVRQVTFEVENMRVLERTDFNRLRLHIETDGSIAPHETLRQAAKILIDHFSLLTK